MRIGLQLALAISLGLPVMSFRANAQDTTTLTNAQDKVGYAIGMNIGENLKRANFDVNLNELMNGIKDVLAGRKLKLNPMQARKAIMSYEKQRMQELAAKNIKAGEQFLAQNKEQPGVKTKTVALPNGKSAQFQYKIITPGTGETPGSNDTVTVNYRGTLINGKVFDSSYKRGHPAKFRVGRVIRGWSEALQMMKVGAKWDLYIPASLAYGDRNMPGIQPGSTLIFEVNLLSIDHPKPKKPITSDIIRVPSAAEMKKGAKIQVIKPDEAAKMAASQTNAKSSTK